MTTKLRVRFVVFSMLALFLMQSLILVFSTQRSYSNMVTKADKMILEIKDAYPKPASVDARYFVAIIGRGEDTKSLDLNNISSVNREEAHTYVKRVLNAESEEGFVDTFRYKVFKEVNGITVIFLSRIYSIDTLKNAILSSVKISIIGMCVMFVILLFASRWVTQPITSAYKKQQQFITSASHELGTPLTVIKADAAILLGDDPNNEWLQDIDKQAERLTAMTRNLIMLAKMDEQDKPINEIEFPISDLAEDVVKSYQTIAETADRVFEVSIIPGLAYCGDENLVRQVFTILLDNAFKYCTAEGTIAFDLKKASQGISVTVTNTTEQITNEQLPHLFDRFYRAENATATNKIGHGLGLSIAESIVKKHRGKIFAKAPSDNVFQITALFR